MRPEEIELCPVQVTLARNLRLRGYIEGVIAIPIRERFDMGSSGTPLLQELSLRDISTDELEQNRPMRRPPIGNRIEVEISIDIAPIGRTTKLSLEKSSHHRITQRKARNGPFLWIAHLCCHKLMQILDRERRDQAALTPPHDHRARNIDARLPHRRNRFRDSRQRRLHLFPKCRRKLPLLPRSFLRKIEQQNRNTRVNQSRHRI